MPKCEQNVSINVQSGSGIDRTELFGALIAETQGQVIGHTTADDSIRSKLKCGYDLHEGQVSGLCAVDVLEQYGYPVAEDCHQCIRRNPPAVSQAPVAPVAP